MKVLGFDTSTRFLLIGVFDGSNIYEYNLDLNRGHDIYLIKHIKRIMEVLKMRLEELDYLAVGLGPGSFTGTRIAVSTAKGLSLVLKKKIVGISTLEIIAYNAISLENVSYICPILDAKRNLVYTCLYRKEKFSLKKVIPLCLIDIDSLLKNISEKTVFLGDGLSLYKKTILTKASEAILLDEDFFYPRATNLIKIALDRISKRRFVDIMKLKPIYLYTQECQIHQGSS